jgi:hypothetical protein
MMVILSGFGFATVSPAGLTSPQLTYAYPGTVIYDQSQVATILPVRNLNITIEGRYPDYWRQSGSRPKFGWRAIDLLPGKYKIKGSFYETYGSSSRSSAEPCEIVIDVAPGRLYKIHYSSAGRSWNMYINEDVSDSLKKNIVKGREEAIAALKAAPELAVQKSDPVGGIRQAVVMLPKDTELSKVETAILKGLAARKWTVDSRKTGEITAHYTRGEDTVKVLVKYTQTQFDVYCPDISQNWLSGIIINAKRNLGIKK